MFCIRCGATLPEEAAFCGKCGKPTDNAPQSAMQKPPDPERSLVSPPAVVRAPKFEPPIINPVASSQHYRPISFTGRGSDVFSKNGMVALLCAVSFVGFPAAIVFIYRWLARNTYIRSGQNLAFVGAIGVMYWITFLYLLLQLAQRFLPLDNFYALFSAPWLRLTVVALTVLFFYALQGWVGFLQLRYCVKNLCLPDGTKLEVNVPLGKYIGIQLVGILSLVTVIGWAWWGVWYMKWLARRISAPNVSFRFSGTDLQCLWRVTAALVASAPLVTIPWTYAWLVRWFVSSVEINSTEIEKETLSASS